MVRNEQQSLVDAFKCAGAGIAHACIAGRNFKIELGFAVAAVILGFVCSIDVTQWAVVFVCIGAVLGLECLNTSMEAAVDLVSPEYNELARIAKDCAAGAVLMCSIASFFVAVVIFLPKLLAMMGILG